MKPRCYVSMPFGTKKTSNNREIHFDGVYRGLICPAAAQCGLDVVRLDEHLSNAPILDTAIQLITDSQVMVCDLTTNNANVIYELGIRHAFVPSGTVLILQEGENIPFYLSHFFVCYYTYPCDSDTLHDDVNRLSHSIAKIASDKAPNQVYRKARYAKHYDEYNDHLRDFHIIAPYERSIFIMTKFPQTDENKITDLDRRLEHIIDVIKRSVSRCGFFPRIAYERRYHPLLWKNIEIYLLGCSKGIAVVEDKYADTLNPNVSIEWGWMRAERKDVLYLLEKGFCNQRADFTGFLSESFSWEFPDKDIDAAIERWLGSQE